MARELKRVNLNLPSELVERVDKIAESMYMDRTAAIVFMIVQYMQQQESLKTLGGIVAMKDELEKSRGSIDER